MKTIEIPRGMKIACGKQLWVASSDGYIPVCGTDGHLCKECRAWNDANCTKDDGGSE